MKESTSTTTLSGAFMEQFEVRSVGIGSGRRGGGPRVVVASTCKANTTPHNHTQHAFLHLDTNNHLTHKLATTPPGRRLLSNATYVNRRRTYGLQSMHCATLYPLCARMPK